MRVECNPIRNHRRGEGLRASNDFKDSAGVGDIASMLTLAITVGFGLTGVMLYMFTTENLRQYAVLNVMGAPARMLIGMIFAQAGLCAVLIERRISISHDVVHPLAGSGYGRAGKPCGRHHQRLDLAQGKPAVVFTGR
jgi:hypothetical protein